MPGSRSTGEADALGLPLRRVVGGSNSQGLGHEYLVDAVAVHVHDLEGEPLPLEAVTYRAHAHEVGYHHPAHGLVIPLLLAGVCFQAEAFLQLFGDQSVHHSQEPSPWRTTGAWWGSSRSPTRASRTSAGVRRPSMWSRSATTSRTSGRLDRLNAASISVAGAPSGGGGGGAMIPAGRGAVL